MKYTVICLLVLGCGSVTEVMTVMPDSGQSNIDEMSGDASGAGGAGGKVTVDAGTGGSLPAPTGSGGSIAVGTGGAQGTGGSVQSTGGSSGSGGNGTGGTTTVDAGTPTGNLACGLNLLTCTEAVDSIGYDMVYSGAVGISPKTPRICTVNSLGSTVTDDTEFFHDVRCAYCGVAQKHEVYNCLIKANTVIGVDPTSRLPIKNDLAVFCLPLNGVCPDIGVHYTRWNEAL